MCVLLTRLDIITAPIPVTRIYQGKSNKLLLVDMKLFFKHDMLRLKKCWHKAVHNLWYPWRLVGHFQEIGFGCWSWNIGKNCDGDAANKDAPFQQNKKKTFANLSTWVLFVITRRLTEAATGSKLHLKSFVGLCTALI